MKNLRRVLKYIIPYKGYALLNILFNILSSLFNVFTIVMVVPMLEILFYGETSNKSFNQPDDIKGEFFTWLGDQISSFSQGGETELEGKLNALLVICFAIIITFFLKNLTRYFGMFFMAKIRTGVVKDLRAEMYSKTLSLPVYYFNEQRKGDLISKITNDVQEVEWSIMSSLEAMFKEPIMIIILLSGLIISDPGLTVFIFLVLPPTGIIISLIGKSLKRTAVKAQSKLGDLIALIEESITGLKIVKVFSAESFMKNKFDKENQDYQRILTKTYRKRDLASPLSEFLSVFALALVIWYGGSNVLELEAQGIHSAKYFINYIMMFALIMAPVKAFTTAFYNLKKGAAAEERINELLKEENPIVDGTQGDIKDFEDSINIESIDFSFDQDNPLFQDLNLEIKKGETVALVGQSGSGKTTLSNLVSRFFDVNGGAINIDGTNIKDVSLSSLRKQMAVVTQESILFHDTVLNNIAFGDVNPNVNRVKEAARIANAIEFIDKLEDGYNTNIGEGGSKLSGGQRQRLCIARAIYKNPPILILDEATSALDTASERLVQEALSNVMKDRTSIVIAHRLSTIQNADHIVVFEDGVIKEKGSHQDLISLNGIYKKLCDLQSFS